MTPNVDSEIVQGLTDPQKKILADVRLMGVRIYNGRARRSIEALEAAGLVEVDWDLTPHAIGSWTQRITVKPLYP